MFDPEQVRVRSIRGCVPARRSCAGRSPG